MNDQNVVYKRTSAWWVATCYLFGTLFLLLYATISLLGVFTDIGIAGFHALSDNAEQTELRRSIATSVKDEVKLIGYKVAHNKDANTLTLSIKNESHYTIGYIDVEVAELDQQGLPTATREERLHKPDNIYPGDTAHGELRLPPIFSSPTATYAVRISGFSVKGSSAIDKYCESLAVDQNQSL